jgi:sugar (pentulose or hexulose) kinase
MVVLSAAAMTLDYRAGLLRGRPTIVAMPSELLLAIDVGTQSVRAIVFDRAGTMRARAQTPLAPAFVAPQPGWAEQDAWVYWQALQQCCQALWNDQGVPPARVAGLAVTTQRGTVVCAAADGTPLRPAIVWPDQRLCSTPPPLGPMWSTLFRMAGARELLAGLQRQAEANWLAQHEPALWQRCERFVLLSAWLGQRLVGDWVDSVASQVGYLPFDYRRQRWARGGDWKWRALAVRPGQLPRLVPPGRPLGTLTAGAAAALGLPRGLPVMAAAADKACEVLGCGALEPDIAHLSFGTAASINTTQPRYMEVQRLLPAYPAALPGAFNTEVHIARGFWLVSWFKQEFGQAEAALARTRGVSAESLFEDLLRATPPGAHGLVLQPFWSPGLRDPGPEAKGCVIGFGDAHTRAHLYRSIVEGVVYALRAGRERIEARSGRPVRRLRVSGGGAASDGALQITADVFGLPAERPDNPEASALGAAMLCASGLGWFDGPRAAAHAMARPGRRFEPDVAAVRVYDDLYRHVYRPLYGRLRPLYRQLRRITGHAG